MSLKLYYGLVGQLSTSVDSDSEIIAVNNTVAGALAASGFTTGDYTYLALSSGGLTEIVRVYAQAGTLLTVERGIDGTIPSAFPVGTLVSFSLPLSAILGQIPSLFMPEFVGEGTTEVFVDGDTVYIYTSPPTIQGHNGIEVIRIGNTYSINYNPPEGNCCGCSEGGGSSGGGISSLTGEGIVSAFVAGATGIIGVQEPNFTGNGLTIEGSWPNYTFTVNSTGGGTVTSVSAGTGLVVTGSPTVNPTVSIANTGVVAGNYGGVVVNARGQLTAIPSGFDPISAANSGSNVTVNRVGDAITVSVENAAVGQRGAVALADETDPFDPDDNVNAATPAVVAAAMATLAGASVTGVSSFVGEVSTDYTNVVGGSAQSLVLASGEKALVMAEATILNATTPLTPVDFGMAVFNSTAMLQGNKRMTQSSQQLTFVVNGPFNDTVALATTAVPAGSTLTSYGLAIVKF